MGATDKQSRLRRERKPRVLLYESQEKSAWSYYEAAAVSQNQQVMLSKQVAECYCYALKPLFGAGLSGAFF